MIYPLVQGLRRRALQASNHEAGHFVLARLLGFGTGPVTIRVHNPTGHFATSAITLSEPTPTLRDVRTYARRRSMVLYAGALAETLPQTDAPKKVDFARAVQIFERYGAEQDAALARELVHLLHNIEYGTSGIADETTHQSQLDAIKNPLYAATIVAVEDYADIICDVGSMLASKVQQYDVMVGLTAAELDAIPSVARMGRITVDDAMLRDAFERILARQNPTPQPAVLAESDDGDTATQPAKSE